MRDPASLKNLIWVGLGGMAGASLRQGTNQTVITLFGEEWYYLATSIENILGSFLMGAFFVYLARRFPQKKEFGLFLLTGLIGSYTTYSGFGTQAILLLQESPLIFASYFFGQILLGLVMVIVGMKLAK